MPMNKFQKMLTKIPETLKSQEFFLLLEPFALSWNKDKQPVSGDLERLVLVFSTTCRMKG